jgi:dihydrofolate reductase
MSAAVLYMSMSLDGFVAGPNETVDNGLGDGGERLHDWALRSDAGIGRPPGLNGEVWDEMMATGAVVAGRGTFQPAGGWGGDHHDGVPIFILCRDPAGEPRQWPLVTYIDDITVLMARARDAAGARDVLVHGVTIAHLALAAGVLDVIELHVIPVLLGQGRRLFGERGPDHIELERMRVLAGEDGVTHMRYQVRH